MRGKGPKAPFASLFLGIFLFGRKKTSEAAQDNPTAQPQPFDMPEVMRKSIADGDANMARDHLRIASIERDIIGGALTKIYEAEARGQLSENERTQLVQRYKADLKRVDSEIDSNKRVVDLAELESAKADLLKSFQEKLLEIDQRINQIRPSVQKALVAIPTISEASHPAEPAKPESGEGQQNSPAPKDRPVKEKPKNKAEERIDAIREEVLKAMERLEQIETEG